MPVIEHFTIFHFHNYINPSCTLPMYLVFTWASIESHLLYNYSAQQLDNYIQE